MRDFRKEFKRRRQQLSRIYTKQRRVLIDGPDCTTTINTLHKNLTPIDHHLSNLREYNVTQCAEIVIIVKQIEICSSVERSSGVGVVADTDFSSCSQTTVELREEFSRGWRANSKTRTIGRQVTYSSLILIGLLLPGSLYTPSPAVMRANYASRASAKKQPLQGRRGRGNSEKCIFFSSFLKSKR